MARIGTYKPWLYYTTKENKEILRRRFRKHNSRKVCKKYLGKKS